MDGNITHAPSFVASNDFRLAWDSPCIDAGSNGLVIAWHSVSNQTYSVYSGSNLADGLDVLLEDQIPGTPPFNTYTDTVTKVDRQSYGVAVENQP